MKELKFIHKGIGISLLRALERQEFAIGGNRARALLKNKNIKVNGQRIRSNIQLMDGDSVSVYVLDDFVDTCNTGIDIIYKDSNIAILDKPKGVDVYRLQQLVTNQLGTNVELVHRLDTNTCGLICVALNDAAKIELEAAFKERRVEKIYHAIVVGELHPQSAVLKAYLKKDAKRSLVQVMDNLRDFKATLTIPQECKDLQKLGYKPIQTSYNVLERKQGCTKIEVKLLSGKTHQIRAHFAHIGHPLIGDGKYGSNKTNKLFQCNTQALVSKILSFTFPLNATLCYLNTKIFKSKYEVDTQVVYI